MLGAPCSPCCAAGCTTENLYAFYDRIRSSSCSIALSGTLPRQDAATQFSPGYGGSHTVPPSGATAGTWQQWQEWQCPSQLSLALESSYFEVNPLEALIVFFGQTETTPPSRLLVRVQVRLFGGRSASGGKPSLQFGQWSLLPGTQACWLYSDTRVEVRAGQYIDTRGVLDQAVTQLQPVAADNNRIYFAWTVGAPIYQISVNATPAQVCSINAGPGGSAGFASAWWPYIRDMPIDETTGFAQWGNEVSGSDQGNIFTNTDAVAISETAVTISHSQFRRDPTFYPVSFNTWKPNPDTKPNSRWLADLRNPSGGVINFSRCVTWDYDASATMHTPTDFGPNWLTNATVTLS